MKFDCLDPNKTIGDLFDVKKLPQVEQSINPNYIDFVPGTEFPLEKFHQLLEPALDFAHRRAMMPYSTSKVTMNQLFFANTYKCFNPDGNNAIQRLITLSRIRNFFIRYLVDETGISKEQLLYIFNIKEEIKKNYAGADNIFPIITWRRRFNYNEKHFLNLIND